MQQVERTQKHIFHTKKATGKYKGVYPEDSILTPPLFPLRACTLFLLRLTFHGTRETQRGGCPHTRENNAHHGVVGRCGGGGGGGGRVPQPCRFQAGCLLCAAGGGGRRDGVLGGAWACHGRGGCGRAFRGEPRRCCADAGCACCDAGCACCCHAARGGSCRRRRVVSRRGKGRRRASLRAVS